MHTTTKNNNLQWELENRKKLKDVLTKVKKRKQLKTTTNATVLQSKHCLNKVYVKKQKNKQKLNKNDTTKMTRFQKYV